MKEPEFIKNNDFLKLKFISSSLPILIAFSSVNTAQGRFKPYKIPYDSNVNVIFVNDEGNNWYLNGIPGLSDSVEESSMLLVKLAKSIGNGQVVTFGTSMGAYAAILYAILGGADGYIVFGPEPELLLPGSRSEQYLKEQTKANVYDLRALLSKSTIRNYIFLPESDEIDLLFWKYYSDLESLNIILLRAWEHPGLQSMSSSEASRMLTDFARGLEINTEDYISSEFIRYDKTPITAESISKLYNSYTLRKEGNLTESLNVLRELDLSFQQTDLFNFKIGESYRRMGDKKHALLHWNRALKIFNKHHGAMAKVSAEYMRSGQLELALELINQAIDLNPYSAHQFNTRGEIYNKLYRFCEAELAYREAVRLNKGNKHFRANLKKFLSSDITRKSIEVESL